VWGGGKKLKGLEQSPAKGDWREGGLGGERSWERCIGGALARHGGCGGGCGWGGLDVLGWGGFCRWGGFLRGGRGLSVVLLVGE